MALDVEKETINAGGLSKLREKGVDRGGVVWWGKA